MLIRRPEDIKSSEITDEKLYGNRRQFLRAAGIATIASAAGVIVPAGCAGPSESEASTRSPQNAGSPSRVEPGTYDTDEEKSPYEMVTGYNNFYEFGVDKLDPVKNAGTLRPRPWKVKVEGLVKKPATWDVDDLLSGFTMEDRVYRMRCVEGWSMVIPWYGFPLAKLIDKLEPLPSARYIRMETLYDPDQMPGQRRAVLDWPYVEGLRMDEAMNPLTLMAVGVYGKEGPNQNGAPIRVVIPWKYGFKGVKSIVNISFEEKQPLNTWQAQAAHEYGFFANVNPEVDHPRWTQARERRLGEFFKRETLMFNGYGEHVAHMYAGMDLRKYY
jgi:sulfoxide reductase catalytic subunit YedY